MALTAEAWSFLIYAMFLVAVEAESDIMFNAEPSVNPSAVISITFAVVTVSAVMSITSVAMFAAIISRAISPASALSILNAVAFIPSGLVI